MGRRRFSSAFWTLWVSSGLSNLSDGIIAAALPLLAASLTTHPQLVAGLTMVRTLPFLLFGLPAGAIADRSDRRRLMIVTDIGRALLLTALAVALAAGSKSLLLVYAIVFVVGCFETLFDTAVPSLLPAVVPRERLETANGLLQSSERLANEFLGPIIGAFLFAVTMFLPFEVYAAALVASAVALAFVKASFRKPSHSQSFGADVAEGIRWLWRHRLLRSLSILIAVIAFTDSAWFALLVLFATRLLSLEPAAYGILLASGAAGSVLGSLVAPWVSRKLGAGTALLGSLIGLATAQVLIGVSNSAVVVAVLLAASGAAFMVWNVISVSLRQALTPDRLLGRVTSLYRLFGLGAMPLGAFTGGVVGEHLGLRAPFFLGAPLLIGAAVVSSRFIGNSAVARARAAWEESALPGGVT